MDGVWIKKVQNALGVRCISVMEMNWRAYNRCEQRIILMDGTDAALKSFLLPGISRFETGFPNVREGPSSYVAGK